MINTKFEENLLLKTQVSNSASMSEEYLKAKLRIARSPLCNLLKKENNDTNDRHRETFKR